MKLSAIIAAAFSLVLLTQCTAPDRIGVGANASQRDMLGYSSSTFLEDQTGMGYGLGVWAEWDLGGAKPIAFEWPKQPPWYLAKPDGTPQPITLVQPGTEPEAGGIEAALEVGETVNSWGPAMQIGFWILMSVIVAVLGKRLLDHFLAKKHAGASK